MLPVVRYRMQKTDLITKVVIGWNGRVTAGQCISGSILDNLLTQSCQAIYVCKLLHPLSIMNRMVVAVGPSVRKRQLRDPLHRTDAGRGAGGVVVRVRGCFGDCLLVYVEANNQ